jgi:hypothetical protein
MAAQPSMGESHAFTTSISRSMFALPRSPLCTTPGACYLSLMEAASLSLVDTLAPTCSDRRAEANRRNAQRSTGPRTAEGKARSSLCVTASPVRSGS